MLSNMLDKILSEMATNVAAGATDAAMKEGAKAAGMLAAEVSGRLVMAAARLNKIADQFGPCEGCNRPFSECSCQR